MAERALASQAEAGGQCPGSDTGPGRSGALPSGARGQHHFVLLSSGEPWPEGAAPAPRNHDRGEGGGRRDAALPARSHTPAADTATAPPPPTEPDPIGSPLCCPPPLGTRPPVRLPHPPPDICTCPGSPLASRGTSVFPLPGTLPGPCAPKDTETLICDFKVPQVYPQVVCRHVGLVVTVDGDGVDVVGMSVGEHPAGGGLHHQVHGPEHGYLREGSRGSAPRQRAQLPPGPHQHPARGTRSGPPSMLSARKPNAFPSVRTERQTDTKAFCFPKRQKLG